MPWPTLPEAPRIGAPSYAGAAVPSATGTGGGGVPAESGAALTYTSGVLTRIDYPSGNYKLFTYTSGKLTQLTYIRPGQTTIQKDFAYSGGLLVSITQTEY